VYPSTFLGWIRAKKLTISSIVAYVISQNLCSLPRASSIFSLCIHRCLWNCRFSFSTPALAYYCFLVCIFHCNSMIRWNFSFFSIFLAQGTPSPKNRIGRRGSTFSFRNSFRLPQTQSNRRNTTRVRGKSLYHSKKVCNLLKYVVVYIIFILSFLSHSCRQAICQLQILKFVWFQVFKNWTRRTNKQDFEKKSFIQVFTSHLFIKL
jgi:hypothetical protein